MTSAKDDFLKLNQRSFQELIVFLDFADKFTLGFVEVNFLQDAEILIETLQNHPECLNFQFLNLTFNQVHLKFLLPEIEAALDQNQKDSSKKLVLAIKGLENAIHVSGDYPPLLLDLNFVRDAYPHDIPHPVLFILPDYALTRLAKFAPDFWAWRSGVFRFRSVQSTLDTVATRVNNVRWPESLPQREKEEHIQLLLRLLMEYRSSRQLQSSQLLSTEISILIQLGDAYLSQADIQQAILYYQDALNSSEKIADYINQEAALKGLGRSYDVLSDCDRAIAYLDRALTIARTMGNHFGEAEILFDRGQVYHHQANYTQAIICYEDGLKIVRDIGDRRGEGLALGNLGNTYDALGQHTEAIACYQKALEIASEIGNLREKGTALGNLGIAHYYLGHYILAIEFQEQALKIVRDLGDRRSEGIALSNLGNAYNALEQYTQAIEFLQQALAIARTTGDLRGERIVLDNLSSTYYYLGQSRQAQELHQQSLKIAKKLGLDKTMVWFN
jgi:tetratricopeptide (TPR) repeat protein